MGVAIGAIVAVIVAVGVEYLRRPKLRLTIETPICDIDYPPSRPAQHARHLRLKLLNEPLPAWAQWMVREPAL